MSIRSICTAAALLAVLCLSTGILASYAIPTADTGSGRVQAMDHAAHTLTLSGHVYKLSPKAVYISGSIRGLDGLQPGMMVRFIADGPVANPESRIINIVVQPPEAP